MKKISLFAALTVYFLLSGQFSASSQIVIKVKPNKPKTILVQPKTKKAGHIWIDGHWLWSKKENKYVWIKGHWAKPPRVGAVWTSGHWADTPGGFKWVPGHWQSPRSIHSKKQFKKPRK